MTQDMAHRPRKRFGQNFLHNKGVIDHIIEEFDPDPNFAIVEIGPGKGALTIPLLKKMGSINAIEIDTDLALLLSKKCKEVGDLKLHIGDALKFDFSKIQPAPLQIIGNLPYNVSTALMFYLLKKISITKIMILMLQKEVVDRICANHNEADYGRLSVMIQSQCQVEKLFNVAPGSFTPAPKVTSAVLKLLPDTGRAGLIKDVVLFEALVRQAFSQRRKTLRNSLKGLVDVEGFEALSILPTSRAENVSVKDYVNMANMLYHQQNQ
ncbi:MAG: 16S rRNA (adenine1518-N6/adenine1519-N6)-dimethyltransferase [Gammaproteobacteria bacterium]|jgi:16S rRNA (adenine1518-N6/adenine1519-N6)-dimethyltransferase